MSRAGRRAPLHPVRIRKARHADAPAIAAVMRSSIRTLARGAHPAGALAAWSSLPPLYHAWAMSAGGERCFAAERARRLVGYAALRGAEVTAVFVRPGVARRGVGASLLARLEREARRSGVRALWTKAAVSAEPFYRARGFVGGRAVRVPLPGGEALAAVLLRKPLVPRAPRL